MNNMQMCKTCINDVSSVRENNIKKKSCLGRYLVNWFDKRLIKPIAQSLVKVAYWTGFHNRSGCISATPAPPLDHVKLKHIMAKNT